MSSAAWICSRLVSADDSLTAMTRRWMVSSHIRSASQPRGTRTSTPTPATTSATRHRRFDSETSAICSGLPGVMFELGLRLADEVERAGYADETARRRVRPRDGHRVTARRRERDCTRRGRDGHGAEQFFDGGGARVLGARQGEGARGGGGGGGEWDAAAPSQPLAAHRAEARRPAAGGGDRAGGPGRAAPPRH